MSMYIIYPADELIQCLLASEYSVPTSRTSQSPILPHGHPPFPVNLCRRDRDQRSSSRSTTSSSASVTTVIAPAPIPPCKSDQRHPLTTNRDSSSGRSVSPGPAKFLSRLRRSHSALPAITVSNASSTSTPRSRSPTPQLPPPPTVPVRKNRKDKANKGLVLVPPTLAPRPDKVYPVLDVPTQAFGPGRQRSPSGKLTRFSFERIEEEREEEDTFRDFSQQNRPRVERQVSFSGLPSPRPPPSPTPSIRSWKLSTRGGRMAGIVRDRDSGGGLSALAANLDGLTIKDLVHPTLNESLKSHNALSFKLIRIVSDFTQQLSQLHEQHAVELQLLVENFRKRNAEIRKERPPCGSSLFQVWETLLQEVEIDSQAHSDVAGSLGRQVARQLLEKTFCRKIQSRKIFAHRESFETVLSKTEALLSNTYRDYCEACQMHIQQGNSNTLGQYYEAHNTYVHQLRGTNAMLKEYQSETLPALLQELEEIYIDLCRTLAESILHEADVITTKGQETTRRYENLTAVCRNVNGLQDLREYVKCLTIVPPLNQRHAFTLPVSLLPPSEGGELPNQDQSHVPVLKDEVVQDRLSAAALKLRHESLKKEMVELESEMRQLQDSLDTLIRMQQRSLDSNLFNKANELQEEISMKRFDLRVAQMHLSALRAQRELFAYKTELGSGGGGGGDSSSYSSGGTKDRKMSIASTTTMKSKWLKAFRSLKTSPSQPSTPVKETEKKNGKDKDNKESFQIFENHIFQEYTYKKITPCDICSKILRGHTRQGFRCRMCKTNVHFDCQEKVGKCQPKTRLLRRQRSTSELETRLTHLTEADGGAAGGASPKSGSSSPQVQQKPNDEPDLIYQVLKQATDMKKPGTGGSSSGSGSGNGFHGSSQTLSQPDFRGSASALPSAALAARRSNPTVNVEGNQSGMRRDSYVSRKSISADAGGGSNPALFLFPPPRAISLPSTQTPHSPRRRKLDLRMKSFSLDSPESTEHAQRRRYAHGSQSTSHSQYWRLLHANPSFYADGTITSRSRSTPNAYYSNTASSSNSSTTLSAKQLLLDFYEYHSAPQTSYVSPLHFAPSSPVHNRKALLSTRNVRMSSVELPDENDKSLSSASTSPCPSPKPHRLLPTNLYVVLYMFKARHQDELDLKAGYKVTVTDTTDPDWWQGKCMGRIGYFPSKYVTKLHPGERPLQVTHNLQVTDGAENGLKLLRDQIVIQVGEELDGMVTIRNGENKQGVCPLKYLQEV